MMPYHPKWHENHIKISGFPPRMDTESRGIDEQRDLYTARIEPMVK